MAGPDCCSANANLKQIITPGCIKTFIYLSCCSLWARQIWQRERESLHNTLSQNGFTLKQFESLYQLYGRKLQRMVIKNFLITILKAYGPKTPRIQCNLLFNTYCSMVPLSFLFKEAFNFGFCLISEQNFGSTDFITKQLKDNKLFAKIPTYDYGLTYCLECA